MDTSFQHRLATPDDFEALEVLQSSSMLQLSEGFYDLRQMEIALGEVTLLTRNILGEGHFQVITTQDGGIVACGGWSRATPGYAAAAGQGVAGLPEGTAIVRSVYTTPQLSRRGLGRQIMSLIEADAAAHGIETLTLTATKPGIPLYLATGYRPIKRASATLSSGYVIELLEMVKFVEQYRNAA